MRFTLTPAALTPGWREAVLSLAEARAQCRVDGDGEDDLIAAFRDAALDTVERRAGVSLVERGFTLELDRFPTGAIALPVAPLASVQSVTHFDDGVQASFADWRVSGGWLLPKPNKTWPSVTGPVVVAFRAGFADAGESAPALLQAARLLVDHFYENRSAVVTGPASELPLAVGLLIDSVRLPSV